MKMVTSNVYVNVAAGYYKSTRRVVKKNLWNFQEKFHYKANNIGLVNSDSSPGGVRIGGEGENLRKTHSCKCGTLTERTVLSYTSCCQEKSSTFSRNLPGEFAGPSRGESGR